MKKNRFIILVGERNVAKWIRRCLNSIVKQDYDYNYYEVIVMDDCSTDGTWEFIQEYRDFNSVRNDPRLVHYISNFIKGIKMTAHDPEDIILQLGGDDYLASNDVLSHLNEVYQDPDVWMTYGQFVPESRRYGPYCKPIPDTRTYRKSGMWVTSHLVTCKRWLWDKIDDADLRYADGEYPNHSFDRAFMYPMIEMSGAKHIRFIEKILYVYNDVNPNSIMYLYPLESIKEAEYYMNKPSYKEL
jgi:glycosyltransferase involved in cell wall biosynthesis